MSTFGRIKLNAIFNVTAILPAIIGVASVVFMGYVFWWPPKSAYEIYRPSEHRVTYADGFIRVHRAYCVNEEIPITVSRDLIRIGRKGENELRIALPQTVQIYGQGCQSGERILAIPATTPPGNYRLSSIVTWHANPFREGIAVMPELYLTIGAFEQKK